MFSTVIIVAETVAIDLVAEFGQVWAYSMGLSISELGCRLTYQQRVAVALYKKIFY